MTTDGGGWTVFQRRLDGSVDFYRDWKAYKEGFGSLSGEFWLGNDNLHRLTNANDVMLRVDLEDFEGNITYAEYKTFKVADEADKYRLTLGEYNGIPSCIIGIVNSQEIHWCWMRCVLSLFWAESRINQKRFLNSVLSSFLIFFKRLPLRPTVIGIVGVVGRMPITCSGENIIDLIWFFWKWEKNLSAYWELIVLNQKLVKFPEMLIAVLRLSGDESLVFWGPISWSSLWALTCYKLLKSL